MWERCGSDKPPVERQRLTAGHRSPHGLRDRRQQSAASARALQAGGRPFEPGIAHPQSPLLKRNLGHRIGGQQAQIFLDRLCVRTAHRASISAI